jgi:hypothetical protein
MLNLIEKVAGVHAEMSTRECARTIGFASFHYLPADRDAVLEYCYSAALPIAIVEGVWSDLAEMRAARRRQKAA